MHGWRASAWLACTSTVIYLAGKWLSCKCMVGLQVHCSMSGVLAVANVVLAPITCVALDGRLRCHRRYPMSPWPRSWSLSTRSALSAGVAQLHRFALSPGENNGRLQHGVLPADRQWKTVASLARCSQAWLHALSQRSLQHPALKCIFSFSQLADIFHAARQPARWRHAVADVSHSSMFGKSMSGKLDTRVKLT